MKPIASFLSEQAKFRAFLDETRREVFITASDGQENIKFCLKSGRELAYFIRFASKLLAFYMKNGKRNRDKIIDSIMTNAEAGVDEILTREPKQTMLRLVK